jgi:uncharacterized protein YgiM (DUF1202 family)
MRKSAFAPMVPVFLVLMSFGQSAHSQSDFHKDFFDPQMLWQSPGHYYTEAHIEKAVVLASRLNLRLTPKRRGKIIETLKADQVVEVKNRQDNGWVQINVNNSTGWVASEYLRFAKEEQNFELHAVVDVQNLNLRAQAGTKYKILHTLQKNDKLQVLSDTDERWIEVELIGKHIRGWVATEYLEILLRAKEAVLNQKDADYAIVSTRTLNLRSGPGRDYKVIEKLRTGMHVVSVLPEENGWRKVQTASGTTGWVARRHLKFYEPADFPSKVTNATERLYTSSLEASILNFLRESYDKKTMSAEDKLSIVVQDLETGERLVSIRPDVQIKAASLIKVPVLQAYMLQRFRGKIKHSKQHQRALSKMIRFSSNSDTNKVIRWVGGPNKVNQILADTGLYSEMKMVEYIPRYGKTYLNKVSVEDLNRLMLTLWSDQPLGPEFSRVENEMAAEEILYLMGQPNGPRARDRLKDGTCFARNKNVKVWDKTGFVKGVNGNIGIVQIDTPEGPKSYTVVMAMERANHESISGNANGWSFNLSQHMRRISELIYTYMSIEYHRYNECKQTDRLVYHASQALEQPEIIKTSL